MFITVTDLNTKRPLELIVDKITALQPFVDINGVMQYTHVYVLGHTQTIQVKETPKEIKLACYDSLVMQDRLVKVLEEIDNFSSDEPHAYELLHKFRELREVLLG